MDCCWSAYQTEWATDVMFRDPSALAALYPALVKQATHHFASPDVMRFLGRKVHGNFTGELTGSFKRRPEGVRVKHCLNGNVEVARGRDRRRGPPEAVRDSSRGHLEHRTV